MLGAGLFFGLLFSGIVLWRQLSEPAQFVHNGEPTLVHDRNFVNQRVRLDGFHYVNCTFTNVTFVYEGTTRVELEGSHFYGIPHIHTDSSVVATTVTILKGFGLYEERAVGGREPNANSFRFTSDYA